MSEGRTQQLPDNALGQILARFDSMDTRFDSMDARLTALEETVDRRLQETQPIRQQVLERLTKIESRLGKVEEEVYGLNRKVRIFSVDIVKLQDKDEDPEERLKRVEAEPPVEFVIGRRPIGPS